MFGSACKFLSNLSILDSAELEYIVINLVLLGSSRIVRFMLTTTAW